MIQSHKFRNGRKDHNISKKRNYISNFKICHVTVAHQAPPSIGFPRQEYWSGLPFPSPGGLPEPRMEPSSLAWQADSLPLSHLGSLEQVEKQFINQLIDLLINV